jgi:hypothetical protein
VLLKSQAATEVDEDTIVGWRKKMKLTKEGRLASIMEGREDRIDRVRSALTVLLSFFAVFSCVLIRVLLYVTEEGRLASIMEGREDRIDRVSSAICVFFTFIFAVFSCVFIRVLLCLTKNGRLVSIMEGREHRIDRVSRSIARVTFICSSKCSLLCVLLFRCSASVPLSRSFVLRAC